MKTFRTKLKSSFTLALTIIAFEAWSKPVAQVIDVKGQVFGISPDGKTKALKTNDHLEEKTEIMVGEDGNITINDYYDATYHLVEGSHLKFFDKSVQLKKGKTWVQSMNSRHPLSLTTANGYVDFWKGEFITTFDQGTARSQVLVVNGEVEVSNVLDKNSKFTVTSGHFTMVDPEIENGLPRTPTKVGLTSLNAALAEFKALPEKMKEEEPTRNIASVDEAVPVVPKKGEIVFINAKGVQVDRFPASGSAHIYFKKKTLPKKASFSSAPIRFYGMSVPATILEAPRRPASVKPLTSFSPKKVGTELNIDPEFSQTLSLEQASQPKHSKELENLIQDLKSY